MTKASVTILGCGNSTGIPAIGNHWGDCDPSEPRNARTRSSIALQTAETTLIIDTGPDFRDQINRENIRQIDGVFYTHSHSDHVNGIDELRIIKYRNQQLVPIYGNKETFQDLKARFHYMFDGGAHELYPPILEPFELNAEHFGHEQDFRDIKFTPFIQDHGTIETVGYRFGDFAYSVDMKTLDSAAIQTLKGIRTWVVDGAAYNSENVVHATLSEIYKLNKEVGAKNVYISSLSLGMDYQTLCPELPEGYKPAYDGLKLECLLS